MSRSLRVEIRTGAGDQEAIELQPGTPREPFSVGTEGDFRVTAPGVTAVHAYLYFDGVQLYVASTGAHDVTMRGEVVSTDWTPVAVPMNIHVAGAKLAVRGPAARSPKPGTDEQTRARPMPGVPGGASSGFAAPPDEERTIVNPPGAPFAPVAAPEPPPDSERTRFEPIAAAAPAPAPADQDATMIAPLEAMLKSAPRTAPPGPVARPAAVTAPRAAPQPVVARSPAGVTPQPVAHPQVVVAPQPVAHPQVVVAPQPVPQFVVAPEPVAHPQSVVVSPQATAVPPRPGTVPQPGAPPAKRSALEPVIKGWREASVPQKIILVLLPFAFVSIFVVFREPQPNPRNPSAVSAAASAPSAQTPVAAPATASSIAVADAPSASVSGAPPSASVSAAPPSPTPPARGSTKTPSEERLAADAVAAGNYKEALEHYQALAKAHPDQDVYPQAIAILKRKLSH